MSDISEAAERLRTRFNDEPSHLYFGDDGVALFSSDINKLADAYLRIITKLKAHCNSATNPSDHGLAYEILNEMGER